MLSPEYIRDCSLGAEAVAAEMYDIFLSRMLYRIMEAGPDMYISDREAWQIQVAQETGYLLEDIKADIAHYTGIQAATVQKAFELAGVENVENDNIVFHSDTDLKQSPYLQALMQADYELTMGTWENYCLGAYEEASAEFARILDSTHGMVTAGYWTMTEGFENAMAAAARARITAEYPETVALRAVRTGIVQATTKVSLNRMEQENWDIVLVSSHLGARTGTGEEDESNHAWWQGKYYSRSGTDPRFPSFEVTGYGTSQGLGGWNCRHSFGPGTGRPEDNPFTEYDSEQNKEAEKIQQKQRYLERKVRHAKRDLMQLEAAKEKGFLVERATKQEIAVKRAELEYKWFCREHQLKELRERLKVWII